MGHAGKVQQRERARALRAQSRTLREIAEELDVSKASVSVWVRDVEFTPRPRSRGHPSQRPHPLQVERLADIERARIEAEHRIGTLSDRDLLLFGLGLYAGEGAKRDGEVRLANSNPALLAAHAHWLRRFFEIDESRLRVRLYLHEGLDLDRATRFWSELLRVPGEQFHRPFRAAADPTRRSSKHVLGCPTLSYNCVATHRRVMAMISAVTSPFVDPG